MKKSWAALDRTLFATLYHLTVSSSNYYASHQEKFRGDKDNDQLLRSASLAALAGQAINGHAAIQAPSSKSSARLAPCTAALVSRSWNDRRVWRY
jgi:hypothetical protein